MSHCLDVRKNINPSDARPIIISLGVPAFLLLRGHLTSFPTSVATSQGCVRGTVHSSAQAGLPAYVLILAARDPYRRLLLLSANSRSVFPVPSVTPLPPRTAPPGISE